MARTMEVSVSNTSNIRLEDCRENFRDKDGKPFVVRCPQCLRENWAMAVASGQCCWCGWKEEITEDFLEV